MNVNKIFVCVFLALFAGSTVSLKSQSADEIIGELVNQSDYFALDEQFPVYKDSMQSDMLKLMAEGLLCFYFNQPKESNKIIGKLLIEYQEEMGFENSLGMTSIVLKNLLAMEKYDDAIKATSSLIEQIKSFVDESTIEGFQSIHDMAIDLKVCQPTTLVRGNNDVEIPFTIEKVGRGELMFIPVKVNGKEKPFIFDTGCATMNYVSQDFAKEFGLQIVYDSLRINGVGGSGYGWVGIADSINVGDITYYNSLFIVAPPNPADTVYKVNAVLGAGFLNAVGEIQIHPNDNKLVFPNKETPMPVSGRNMMLYEGQPYLKIYSGDKEQLTLHFDTGNTKSTLSNHYYRKHKDYVQKTGMKATSTSGGFGGIQTKEVYKLPTFTVQIEGCKPATLKEVETDMNNEGFQGWQTEDGSLGMDFVQSFDKVTINYRNMFVKTE